MASAIMLRYGKITLFVLFLATGIGSMIWQIDVFRNLVVSVDGSLTKDRRSNETENILTPSQTRQAHAEAALLKMRESGTNLDGFEAFTSRDYALAHAFPIQWDPCVLENAFQRRSEGEPLEIVLLGGSASTRPPGGCNVDLEGEWYSSGEFAGYVDVYLFQQEKSYPSLKFNLVRMAQGNHDSPTNAVLLDGAVNVNNTDVIMWEFLINDWQPPQYTLLVERLDFFLTRLYVYFRNVNRPPPPIILIYLWISHAGDYMQDDENFSVASHAIEKGVGELVQQYRALGWSISVLDVGAAVKVTPELRNNRWPLFDDGHHPGCQAEQFIAQALQHILYTNLAQSKTCPSIESSKQQQQSVSIPKHNDWRANVDPLYHDLWKDLYKTQARIGSISCWEPRNANFTSLNIPNGTFDYLEQWPKALHGKIDPKRQDRKNGYVIPHCFDHNNLEVTLLEPDLRWVALSIGNDKYEQKVRIYINNVLMKRTPRERSKKQDISRYWKFGTVYLNEWIHLGNAGVPKSDAYRISLCHIKKDIEPELVYTQHWVGVVIPDDFNNKSIDEEFSNGAKSGCASLPANVTGEYYFHIINKHSGLALSVQSSSLTNGASIVQTTVDETSTSGMWRFEAVGNDRYHIINKNSGSAINVAAKSMELDAPIIQFSPSDDTNDNWCLQQQADNWYILAAEHSGYMMDISKGSMEEGAILTQWRWNGGANQWFRLEAVATTAGPSSTSSDGQENESVSTSNTTTTTTASNITQTANPK